MNFRLWPLQLAEPSTEYMIRYLLGELPESSARRFEERCLGDAATFQSVSAAEADLIDAYVHGRLSTRRRTRFEQRFFASAMQREKVANAMVLAKHSTGVPVPARITPRVRFVAMAATLLLLLSAFLLVLRRAGHQRGSEPQISEHVGTTAPRTPAANPVIATLVLSVNQQRGTNQPLAFSISPGIELVRLQVPLSARRYLHYRATVETPDGVRLWSQGNLNEPIVENRGMMNIDVPAAVLKSGVYIVTLVGENRKAEELLGEYSVEISQ